VPLRPDADSPAAVGVFFNHIAVAAKRSLHARNVNTSVSTTTPVKFCRLTGRRVAQVSHQSANFGSANRGWGATPFSMRQYMSLLPLEPDPPLDRHLSDRKPGGNGAVASFTSRVALNDTFPQLDCVWFGHSHKRIRPRSPWQVLDQLRRALGLVDKLLARAIWGLGALEQSPATVHPVRR
jgi:hypothetical protein